jgi:excisionase family DNA binding protein
VTQTLAKAGQEYVRHPPEKRWTVPELAARCSVSERTVWRLIRIGKLGCIQMGRTVRIPEYEYQRFLSGQSPVRAYVK